MLLILLLNIMFIEWKYHYAALLKYYEEHGTYNVPHLRVYECELEGMGEDGGVYHYRGNLLFWLHNQRNAKKGQGTCKMTAERLALLQALVDEGNIIHT